MPRSPTPRAPSPGSRMPRAASCPSSPRSTRPACSTRPRGLLGVDHAELGRLALDAEPGASGAVLVPYFEGERTPNLPDATASFSGLTLANTTRPSIARAAIEGMLCGLADGLDAVRGAGRRRRSACCSSAVPRRTPPCRPSPRRCSTCPSTVPAPGEYVADGAARQAAWALTGERPSWPVAAADPLARRHARRDPPAVRRAGGDSLTLALDAVRAARMERHR